MPERRNPYLMLGLDFGASPQQAQAAFARLSRRLRREPDARYRIEDATWALHAIEHAATDPDVNLAVYRVPANPDAYRYQPAPGILSVAPQQLPRRTGSSEAAVAALRAEVADQLATAALDAAVDTWEAAERTDTPQDGPPSTATPEAATAPEPGAESPTGDAAPVGPAGGEGGRVPDPLAVALGNATLFGVGYLLLRRWGRAVFTIAVTAVLLLIISGFGQPGWFWRVVLALWWGGTVLHGWVLARRPSPAPHLAPTSAPAGTSWPPRRQRLVAAAAAVAVFLAAVGLTVDSRRVGESVAAANLAGDCETATQELDRISGRHRLVDPYLTSRTDGDAEACELLLRANELADTDPLAAAATVRQYIEHDAGRWPGAPDLRAGMLLEAAGQGLEEALTGAVESLAAGFDALSRVLTATPARTEDVETMLADYFDQLPEAAPCDAKANVDWLIGREPSGDVLDAATAQADELAAPVFLACGDAHLDDDRPEQARSTYRTLLDDYPDHRLARDARRGVNAAETRIEWKHVGDLVRDSAYCDSPAKYRAAPAYSGGGPHPVLAFGPNTFTDALQSEWLADDHDDAVLVLCVSGPDNGRVLENCLYEGGTFQSGTFSVERRANRYTVKAYELRTGKRAFETTVETATGGCPPRLEWTCSGYNPNCPPPGTVRATHSDDQVRSAARSWVFP